MPRASPEGSFDVAARHLFRHVNDLNALRNNPLVRSFFAVAARDDRDSTILLKIHERILTEATAPSGRHAIAASETRHRRQHAIVVALCAGEPARDTATRLGLSRRQYYRERCAICTRVSRALLEEPAGPARFDVSDPLRLLFARSEALLDQGCAGKAVNLLEEAWSGMREGASRRVVRLKLAYALISLGAEARAAELLAEARKPSDEWDGGQTASAWLRDHRALTEALIAIEIGPKRDAGHALEMLAKRRIADERNDETTLDVFLQCGDWYCVTGRFSQARSMLARARVVSRRLLHPSTVQQIAMALLAVQCSEDSVDEFSPEYHWLTEALTLSISNGSALGTLSAVCGLMGYYASIGRDDEAYAFAEEALRIVRTTEGIRLLARVGVDIVARLVVTQYWHTLNPLLFEVEKLTKPGSLSWGVLKEAQGSFLRRAGRSDRAQDALAEASDVARNTNNGQLEGIVLRELALARHHAGSVSESVEFMKQAIRLIEEYGSAYSRRITYEAATRVVPDRGIVRLARQARAAMLARANAAPNVAEHEQQGGAKLAGGTHALLSTGVSRRLTIATTSEGPVAPFMWA